MKVQERQLVTLTRRLVQALFQCFNDCKRNDRVWEFFCEKDAEGDLLQFTTTCSRSFRRDNEGIFEIIGPKRGPLICQSSLFFHKDGTTVQARTELHILVTFSIYRHEYASKHVKLGPVIVGNVDLFFLNAFDISRVHQPSTLTVLHLY